MSIVFLVVAAIFLYIFYQYLCVTYMVQAEKPPKSVRIAGITEVAFGVLVWAPLWFIDESKILLLFFQLLGLFWICIAVSLYKASNTGRTICLILSIVRSLTIVGIPFSFLSLYMLYFSEESKCFFSKRNEIEPR